MLKKISLFVASALLAVFLVNRTFFFKPTFLDKTASYLIYPVLKLSHTITKPIKRICKHRRSYKELHTYCKKLQSKQQQLLQENIKLKALVHYDQKSKALVEFEHRYKLKNAVLAKVLVKTLSKEEHSIIVNRGSRDGITKNMAAIYKLQLLGRVSDVFSTYSKIKLITDRHSKVSAYTNTNNSKGIVQGINCINKCHLRYISHLKSVKNGDFVLSSGQGLIFPEGFCLGKIANIKTNDICHNVELEPLVDFTTLEMCHLTNQVKMNLF